MASYQVIGPPQNDMLNGYAAGVKNNPTDGMMKYLMLSKLYGQRYGGRAQNPATYSRRIANVMAGIEPSGDLGDQADGQLHSDYENNNPGQADMEDAAANNSDDANMPISDAEGGEADDNSYQRFAQNDLINKFAPGMTQDQIRQSVLRLKPAQAKDNFNTDVQGVMGGSGSWGDLIKKYPAKVQDIMHIKNGLDIAKDDIGAEGDASSDQGKDSNANGGDMGSGDLVSVLNPDGVPGKIHKDSLQAALKRGYKLNNG